MQDIWLEKMLQGPTPEDLRGAGDKTPAPARAWPPALDKPPVEVISKFDGYVNRPKGGRGLRGLGRGNPRRMRDDDDESDDDENKKTSRMRDDEDSDDNQKEVDIGGRNRKIPAYDPNGIQITRLRNINEKREKEKRYRSDIEEKERRAFNLRNSHRDAEQKEAGNQLMQKKNDEWMNQLNQQKELRDRESAIRDLMRMEEEKRFNVGGLEKLAQEKLASDKLKLNDIDMIGNFMEKDKMKYNTNGRLRDAHGKFVKTPVDLYPSVAPPVIIRPTFKSQAVLPGDSLHQNLAAAMRLRGDSESFTRRSEHPCEAIRITPSSYINDRRTECMTRANAYYGYVVYLNVVVETSVPSNVRLMHIKGGVENITRVLTNPINSTSQVVYGRDNGYAFLCEQDTVANGASNKVLLDTGTTEETCLRYNNLSENNKDSENLYLVVCPLNPQDEVMVVVGQVTYAIMDVKSAEDITKNMYASQLFPPIGAQTFTAREWTNVYDPLTKTQAGTLAKRLAGRIAKYEKQNNTTDGKYTIPRIEQQGRSQRADVFSFVPGYDTANNAISSGCKIAQPYANEIASSWPE